jgi:hypothetical protein
METGELDVHRTHVGGEAVDLGGFRQYIHRRDPSRRMEWSAELDAAAFKGRLAELLAPVKRITVDLTIGIALDNEGRPIPDARPHVYSYEVLGDGSSLFRMSKRTDGRLQLDRLDHDHRVFRQVLKAIVETSTTAVSVEPSDYDSLVEAINAVVPEITASPGRFLVEALSRGEGTATEGQQAFFPVSRGNRREDLAAAVRFFLPRVLSELIRGIDSAVDEELARLQYLGPLRSYPPRHLAFSQHHDPNWFAGGGYAWDVIRTDKAIREAVNSWLLSEDKLQTPYELVVRELVGIDDLDSPLLEKLTEIVDLEILDEKEREQDHPLMWMLDPESVTHDLKTAVKRSRIEKLPELVLVDRRTNTVVSHRDVGIGISQVLPVLVGAYASSGKILAMEQPEIHLHPALQAELGDVFIASALAHQKNTFILETHSEHLILRVLRRIRETSEKELPQGLVPVRPEDVAVLYVIPTREGAIVNEIPVRPDGEFASHWPQGFFEERAKELF